jgi:phosphopantothenoylcysteine decarboxylase/phosphopantothenate--cysteine ligase
MKAKKIIVGVCGGIAAYKAAELVRLLCKAGAQVKVAMTSHATQFVAPLTFETLSQEKVIVEMFSAGTAPLDHITWAQNCDLIIVSPATANFIGKMAHGIGDDFLSTLVMASTAKILVCPSMNTQMFLSPAVQANLKLLQERGHSVMAPAEGELACNTRGPGRLPEPEEILEEARALLTEQDLQGLKILVTAGPTQEAIDPVRYISNRSSGKMGFALARAAHLRGAEVTLISGPTHLVPPQGIVFKSVKTTLEMRAEVLNRQAQSDVILKAAAVLDYAPAETAKQKIKKENEVPILKLVPTPDILNELGQNPGKKGRVLVGFAAETQDLLANARAKLIKKNLDLIVVNDVSRADAGFEVDTNQVKLLYQDGRNEELPLMTKEELADQLLQRVKEIWQKKSLNPGKK